MRCGLGARDRQHDRKTVAIVIVGRVPHAKEHQARVLATQHQLTRPLQNEFGRAALDLFLCVDLKAPKNIGSTPWGTVMPTALWRTDAVNQTERLSGCFASMREYAQKNNTWAGYQWIVRSRPDLVFFEDVLAIGSRSKQAVHARARKVGRDFEGITSEEVRAFGS